MNVLSLFDGMSGGQLALERTNIKYNKYFASEVCEPAIKITQKNYPNTIQLGDVAKIDESVLKKLPKISLLIGGSPCQNVSIAVINNSVHSPGLKGKRSSLFYEYIR